MKKRRFCGLLYPLFQFDEKVEFSGSVTISNSTISDVKATFSGSFSVFECRPFLPQKATFFGFLQ